MKNLISRVGKRTIYCYFGEAYFFGPPSIRTKYQVT